MLGEKRIVFTIDADGTRRKINGSTTLRRSCVLGGEKTGLCPRNRDTNASGVGRRATIVAHNIGIFNQTITAHNITIGINIAINYLKPRRADFKTSDANATSVWISVIRRNSNKIFLIASIEKIIIAGNRIGYLGASGRTITGLTIAIGIAENIRDISGHNICETGVFIIGGGTISAAANFNNTN